MTMRRGGEKFNWRLIFFIFTRLNTFQTFRLGLEQTKKTPKKPCHVQSKSFFCHVDYHLSRIINEKTKKTSLWSKHFRAILFTQIAQGTLLGILSSFLMQSIQVAPVFFLFLYWDRKLFLVFKCFLLFLIPNNICFYVRYAK